MLSRMAFVKESKVHPLIIRREEEEEELLKERRTKSLILGPKSTTDVPQNLTLPIGYRFAPKGYELIIHYLLNKILGHDTGNFINEIDFYDYEPDQLPLDRNKLWRPNEAYFFTYRKPIYSKGGLTSRTTIGGYWKATGKDDVIFHDDKIVGFRKIMVFYWGGAPKGRKTQWVMHEYRLNPNLIPAAQVNVTNLRIGSRVMCYVELHEEKETKMAEIPAIVVQSHSRKKWLDGNGQVASSAGNFYASSPDAADLEISYLLDRLPFSSLVVNGEEQEEGERASCTIYINFFFVVFLIIQS